MKQVFLLLTLFFTFQAKSQNIFTYEKEISNHEKYSFEEIVIFNSEEEINLFGTLITPKKEYDKIIIIVPGSGKDTRHSHYILAEKLLENGYAVFRFDERGIGKSQGTYSELAKDLAQDLSKIVTQLKQEYNTKKIGIIGHSLGGVATLMNVQNNVNPNFIILIETPILKNGDFIYNQLSQNFDNSIPEVMKKNKSKEEVLSFLKGYFNIISSCDCNEKTLKTNLKEYISKNNYNKKFIVLYNDDFLLEMLKLNLETTVKETNIKTYYLTGTKDKIINHQKELNLLHTFNNPNIETKVFQDLNHWLTNKDAKVGDSLYDIDKEALNYILNCVSLQ